MLAKEAFNGNQSLVPPAEKGCCEPIADVSDFMLRALAARKSPRPHHFRRGCAARKPAVPVCRSEEENLDLQVRDEADLCCGRSNGCYLHIGTGVEYARRKLVYGGYRHALPRHQPAKQGVTANHSSSQGITQL
ncbi:MAG: hypothetical protein AB8B82_04230 [Roseovarius sp.]